MKYPYKVYLTKVEDHVFWAAECPSLRGCVAQGETQEEALEQLEINEREWLDAAKEFDIEIPKIPVEDLELYSGKFTVRMAAHVHQSAAELAKKQGVSLNQYVNDAIVAQNAVLSATNQILPCVEHTVEQIKWMYSSVKAETTKVSNANYVSACDEQEEPTYNISYRPIIITTK